MNKRFKAVDLFCGCGGMSPGFQNAGFQIMSAFDNWDPAVKIYSQNSKIKGMWDYITK